VKRKRKSNRSPRKKEEGSLRRKGLTGSEEGRKKRRRKWAVGRRENVDKGRRRKEGRE
jgi:hypothetical protein